MTHSHNAHGAGQVTPRNDEGPTVAAVALPKSKRGNSLDFHGATPAQQAACIIEGEGYARAWLERLQGGTAQPGELAVILSFLTGEMLHGACRLIEKALEVRA